MRPRIKESQQVWHEEDQILLKCLKRRTKAQKPKGEKRCLQEYHIFEWDVISIL